MNNYIPFKYRLTFIVRFKTSSLIEMIFVMKRKKQILLRYHYFEIVKHHFNEYFLLIEHNLDYILYLN
jgi:hypothetical protein